MIKIVRKSLYKKLDEKAYELLKSHPKLSHLEVDEVKPKPIEGNNGGFVLIAKDKESNKKKYFVKTFEIDIPNHLYDYFFQKLDTKQLKTAEVFLCAIKNSDGSYSNYILSRSIDERESLLKDRKYSILPSNNLFRFHYRNNDHIIRKTSKDSKGALILYKGLLRLQNIFGNNGFFIETEKEDKSTKINLAVIDTFRLQILSKCDLPIIFFDIICKYYVLTDKDIVSVACRKVLPKFLESYDKAVSEFIQELRYHGQFHIDKLKLVTKFHKYKETGLVGEVVSHLKDSTATYFGILKQVINKAKELNLVEELKSLEEIKNDAKKYVKKRSIGERLDEMLATLPPLEQESETKEKFRNSIGVNSQRSQLSLSR